MNIADEKKYFDKAFLIALRQEYAAAHNGKQPRMMANYWKFAAETILEAFRDNADDECFDWQLGLVQKHLNTILAENPALADDENSLAYQDE